MLAVRYLANRPDRRPHRALIDLKQALVEEQ
jgi:hypothetical protein